MSMTLQTQRLVLRQPTPNDWRPFHDFMMSDRSTMFGSHKDLGASWRAFAGELGHWQILDYGMWSITKRGSDTALGFVGPWNPPDWPETEIGWMMFDPAIEGTGIATEAARAAISHAWDVLGWTTIVSYILPDNLRSIRLAEKLGAQLDDTAVGPSPKALVYRHPRSGGQT